MRFTWALGVLLLCVVPAKADNISVVGGASFSDVIFGGTADMPIILSIRPVESVDTSFIYNTTSQQISDMNFNSDGPLGPFTFLGATRLLPTAPLSTGQAHRPNLISPSNTFQLPGTLTGEGTKNLDMSA